MHKFIDKEIEDKVLETELKTIQAGNLKNRQQCKMVNNNLVSTLGYPWKSYNLERGWEGGLNTLLEKSKTFQGSSVENFSSYKEFNVFVFFFGGGAKRPLPKTSLGL